LPKRFLIYVKIASKTKIFIIKIITIQDLRGSNALTLNGPNLAGCQKFVLAQQKRIWPRLQYFEETDFLPIEGRKLFNATIIDTISRYARTIG